VRLTRFHLFLLGGLVLAIVGPVAFTQGPGGFGGKGGKKMGFDPETIFKMYSGGADVIDVSTVQVPERMSRFMTTEQLREQMNAFLQKKGVTNGKMTLALYQEYSEERRAAMRGKFGPPGGTPPGTPTPGAPGTTPPTGTAAPTAADIETQAKELFKRLDVNNDGSLSVEEMETASRLNTSRIFYERDKYDVDKNGSIDLNEFIAYYKARVAPPPANGQDPSQAPPEEDKRPVVYRAGKLPKELTTKAPWFEQLDKDKDGQVGLYEWKAAGRPTKDFLVLDVNGDGFITAEELLRYLKINKPDDKKGSTNGSTVASNTSPDAIIINQGRSRGGRGGPGRGGPGGPPGGGRAGPGGSTRGGGDARGGDSRGSDPRSGRGGGNSRGGRFRGGNYGGASGR